MRKRPGNIADPHATDAQIYLALKIMETKKPSFWCSPRGAAHHQPHCGSCTGHCDGLQPPAMRAGRPLPTFFSAT